MKKHVIKATILIIDNLNIKYSVCNLDQVYYDDDTFEYIFKPHYNIIELLDSTIFQGIPGLNLDLKKEQYIRKNKIPTFIYERTPQKNREDLWELLDEVELEYLDHLEWLIRTNKTYTGDNFIVEAYQEPKISHDIVEVNYGDKVILDDVENISTDNFKVLKFFINIVTMGATFESDTVSINDNNRKEMFNLIYILFKNKVLSMKKKQVLGIKKAKEDKKYTGRKKKFVSLPLLEEIIEKRERKEITLEEAMKELGLKSRSTLYRRIKEFKDSQNINK